jgi:hypothetical protein
MRLSFLGAAIIGVWEGEGEGEGEHKRPVKLAAPRSAIEL